MVLVLLLVVVVLFLTYALAVVVVGKHFVLLHPAGHPERVSRAGPSSG